MSISNSHSEQLTLIEFNVNKSCFSLGFYDGFHLWVLMFQLKIKMYIMLFTCIIQLCLETFLSAGREI